jgi:hypothetical protein
MSSKTLKIEHVDRRNDDELVVGYSDKTTAIYSIDQLRTLTPKRIAKADTELEEPSNRYAIS